MPGSPCECLPAARSFTAKWPAVRRVGETYGNGPLGDDAHCARFVVFKAKGREAVPADLFPNERKRARELLAGG